MNKSLKPLVSLGVFSLFIFIAKFKAFGVLEPGGGSGDAAAQLFSSIDVKDYEIAAAIYNVLLPIGVAVGLFGIITAGYAYLTSQGSPDKVKDASEKLTAAILGILFIVLSLVILRVIMNTLLGSNI